MNNITIVIPVYGDWETLNICIESLKKCASKDNTIMLVNDHGPEWEIIEKNILKAIEGCDNFKYYLNAENLGFVKTCNRAVMELDTTDNDILLLNSDTQVTEGFDVEMQEVLYLHEKHGAVCPRSNNATLLTIPVKNSTGTHLSEEQSYNTFLQMQSILPRYSILPTGVGFALLIKRKLIRQFGLFDEIFGKGYNEENDFCARINQYGYNVAMANRAYVYHYESRSFGEAKKSLDAKNREILIGRYPYYWDLAQAYFDKNMGPKEYFADLMVDGIYDKPRLLFDLYEVPAKYEGTSKYGLALLENFSKLFGDKYDIHVLIRKEADELFGVSAKYKNVWHPNNIKGTYHIAFSPSQIIRPDHLFLLNRIALKYVFSMQDIISIRSHYLLMDDPERIEIFRQSIRYCAGMSSISEFSIEDTKAYFQYEFSRRDIPTKVIYHGIDNSEIKTSDEKTYFDEYFFVFGNQYKHKYLIETIETIKNSEYNFVILGATVTGKIYENIYGYKSGSLSEGLLNELIAKSKAIIFPSVYEGFGLPILDGIRYEKKVIATDNQLNRELKEVYSDFTEKNLLLYDDKETLLKCIDMVWKDSRVTNNYEISSARSWQEVSIDTEQFLKTLLDSPIDVDLLEERWTNLQFINTIHKRYSNAGMVSPELKGYKRIKALRKEIWTIWGQIVRRYSGKCKKLRQL